MRLHCHERILAQDESRGKIPTSEAFRIPEVGCL